MSSWIWAITALAALALLWAFYRLAKSASKLSRQGQRLAKQLQNLELNPAVTIRQTSPTELGTAIQNRKHYLNSRAKRKVAKQRRLVDRLSHLSSSESESKHV